jgi:hypothetical protein
MYWFEIKTRNNSQIFPEATSRFSPKQVVHEQTPKNQNLSSFSAKLVSSQTTTISYYLIVFRFKKPGNKTSATF